MDVTDRRLNDNSLSSVPVTENSIESSKKPTSSSKESSSRSKRRDSRSKSPRSRRHRSKSRSYSPSNRGRQRDPRLRGRRSRSPNRGPRSPPRSRKSGSRDRYRSNRRNWSPRKKGPVSPPPIQQQQQQANHGFNMPPPMYDGYNNYPAAYVPPSQAYPSYDYSMQAQPPFNAYPNQGVMQPIPPGDDFQQSNWGHQMAIPPPTLVIPPPIQQVPVETEEEKLKREAAVAKEKKTQRATLGKQREDYRRRATALKRELNTLKEQRDDLINGSEPPSPTTKGFIKENDRLQLQIENKITSIENVIDMLSNIIGTDTSPTPSPPPPPTPVKSKKDKKKKSSSFSDDDSSPERLKSKALESLKKKKGNDLKVAELRTDDDVNDMSVDDKYKSSQKINYVHYDPQMHWCKQCNIFPKTAKDFLIHLHSKEHQDVQKIVEPPWHDKPLNDEMPHYPDAPTKRTPIRGLQFFVPTTGWYCTICSIWMGDLHCASLHLKSQTHANNYNDYNNLNPHFEVDWMGDRHKSYEESRQKNPLSLTDRPPQQQQQQTPIVSIPIPMPVPPPSLSIEQEVIEGIPLQLQIPTTHKLDLDDGRKKKKKKKSEEKKDKKKKKRSKKRRQSSSSSSSSDTSDSEANVSTDKNREEAALSIRVAMRNLLKPENEKKPEDSGGKWTVVQPAQPAPPPPTISTNGEKDNRRDDLLISQWNPEPIISEDEKKLLEQLKGRLQTKVNSKERDVNGSKRSKERSKEPKELNESRERDRDRDRDRNRRKRSRSGSRSRRSRSRERRRRSPVRSRSRGRFRSRSRSTGRYGRSRWSRSRSRSRSGRVEKPIVRYPEFRPRVPEKELEKYDRKKGSRRDQDEPKNGSASGSKTESKKTVIVLKNSSSSKKLPFIGRMPVFKRQTNEEEMKKTEVPCETVVENKITNTNINTNTNYQPYYNNNNDGNHRNVQQMQRSMEDYDDLMPDPMQFVSLMGAAPPPPPMVPPPPSTVDKNEPVLPPGIDEADADLVRKTISDAPLPRKGPLPQDFQDALSIIFDGQKPIPDPPEPDMINLPDQNIDTDSQIIPMQIVDEQSQHTMDLYQASFPLVGQSDADLSFAEDVDIPEPLPMAALLLPHSLPIGEIASKFIEVVEEDPTIAAKKLEDSALMDDLAMLGIDADDMAAQCI